MSEFHRTRSSHGSLVRREREERMKPESQLLRGRADRFEDLWEGVLEQVGELRLGGGWNAIASVALLLDSLRASGSSFEAVRDAEAYIACALRRFVKPLGIELHPTVSAAGTVRMVCPALEQEIELTGTPEYSLVERSFQGLTRVAVQSGCFERLLGLVARDSLRVYQERDRGVPASLELFAALYQSPDILAATKRLLSLCDERGGDPIPLLRNLCRLPDPRVHEAALTALLAVQVERPDVEMVSAFGVRGLAVTRIAEHAGEIRRERVGEGIPLQWELDLGLYPLLAIEHRRLFAPATAKLGNQLLCALRRCDLEEALDISEAWLSSSPNQWDVEAQCALLAHRLRRGEERFAELFESARQQRLPGRATALLGAVLLEIGEQEQAAELLRDALGAIGKDFEFVAGAALQYGRVLLRRGALLKAILIADIGIREARSPIPLLRLKLDALRMLESLPEMVRCQGQMMYLSPLHADSVAHLVQQGLGRYAVPKLLPLRSVESDCSGNDSEALQSSTVRETISPHKREELGALAQG